MKTFSLLLLAIAFTKAFPSYQYPPLHLLEGIKTDTIRLPTLNNEWKNYSVAELKELVDAEFYAFNAYEDMKFFLFTSQNPSQNQEVKINDVYSLRASNFDPGNTTRIFIHGWGGSGHNGGVSRVKNAYMEKGDYNHFGVDWSAGSDTSNYVLAAERVGAAGMNTARFIEFLIREGGASIDDIIVGGHSLGGQVSGHVGKNMPPEHRLRGIVSMDPAGPLFSLDKPDKRIDAGDAEYVEIIHTNIGILGFASPIGDADFYPNGGGPSQPGWVDLTSECAHERSHHFFAESINSDVGFGAKECTSYTGNFFIVYCQGDRFLTFQTTFIHTVMDKGGLECQELVVLECAGRISLHNIVI